jgi:hypothetical protein
MKHIIDFYENEIVATPANTSGMGNPMPATDNAAGSEPLVGKRCKKTKCKKEKISEASILDIDGTLAETDAAMCIVEYVKFLAESKSLEKYNDEEINDIIRYCVKYKVLTSNKPGEIVCNYDALAAGARDDRKSFAFSYSLVCSSSGIEMRTNNFPKSIKKLTFENFGTEVCLDFYGNNDLSHVDLEFVEGHIKIMPMTDDAVVKLGKVNCNTLYIRDNRNRDIRPKGISLKTGSKIQILDLSKCERLGSLIGKKIDIGSLILHQNFVGYMVHNSGFVNQNTTVWASNERF